MKGGNSGSRPAIIKARSWGRFGLSYSTVNRTINHFKLTFVADKPPPPHIAYQEVLLAAQPSAEYFS
jgi:hypothetical protein